MEICVKSSLKGEGSYMYEFALEKYRITFRNFSHIQFSHILFLDLIR